MSSYYLLFGTKVDKVLPGCNMHFIGGLPTSYTVILKRTSGNAQDDKSSSFRRIK